MATLTLADRNTVRHDVLGLIDTKMNELEPVSYETARWLEAFRNELSDASAVRMSARRAFEAMAERGRPVETLQFSTDGNIRHATMWRPQGPREVEARSTFVLFDGIRRDYAGVTVLAANEDVTAIISRWGDGFQVAVYLTV